MHEVMAMVKRIEYRALKSLGIEVVYEMTDGVLIDPYIDYSKKDSKLWIELLARAREISEDLYVRLFYMRGGGTVLIKSEKFGYVMRPVIGQDGWYSKEFYDKEKQCLHIYKEKLIGLLGGLEKQ